VDNSLLAISLGNPAFTSALEFDDGKVMLNFSDPMNGITFDQLVECCGGIETLKDICRSSAAISMVNWTQTPGMTDIWRHFASDILPGLHTIKPFFFVDLADPNRCTHGQIKDGIEALMEVQQHANVVLGLNENECRQLCGVFGITYPATTPEREAARQSCAFLRQHFSFSHVMCHMVKGSAVAWDGGSCAAEGFWNPKPKTTTGAGDHYNAGFFSALIAGLAPIHCLQIGGATSGHFVLTGQTPTRDQVVAFLRSPTLRPNG